MKTIYYILEYRHMDAGMYVEEDDHNVSLFNKSGQRLATFGSNSTLEEIHKVADKELAK